jgi:hypothetical protein
MGHRQPTKETIKEKSEPMNARKTSMFLYLIAKINPQAWDAIIPHGPKISAAAREYMIAMALKGFSAELSNRAVSGRLANVQKRLVASAGSRLAADYGDDDWCGTPWPKRFPFPEPGPFPWFSFSDVMLNPQPLPPKALGKEIGGYLLLLSEATAHEAAAKELKSIGNSLIR